MRTEQFPTELLFRREVSGESHSFFFTVLLSELEREPLSDDDFVELAHKYSTANSDESRYEIRSYDATPITRQGQFCVRYSQVTIDRRNPFFPGLELHMSFEGFACRHPLWPIHILDAHYSERGLPEEFDASLYPEAEELLRGIVIEIEPGVPAA